MNKQYFIVKQITEKEYSNLTNNDHDIYSNYVTSAMGVVDKKDIDIACMISDKNTILDFREWLRKDFEFNNDKEEN